MNYSGRIDEAERVLERLLDELEVSDSKQDEARRHYTAVGEWLNDEKSPLSIYRPEVYGHGSFALGTAIRPLSKEELDVDAACVLSISGIDQRKLKELVGDRLKENATYERMLDPPHGGKRCWTLRYADATRFHLDVLPAVPDDSGWLVAAGVPDRFAKHALRITDSSTFDQAGYWPRSNPRGYADWFREVMVSRNRATLEKRARADVQDLPTYRRSTPLQQVIKILKRHRDAHYAGHEHRPISIVITTLAAIAYEGEETVYEALRAIVTRMRRLLFVAGKHQPVLNPVNPKEDFTDKWRSIPERARVFSEWLDAIEREHDALVTPSDYKELSETLSKSYGRFDAMTALAKHASQSSNATSTAPSLVTLPQVAHRRKPPWPMGITRKITVSCEADKNGLQRRPLKSGEVIGKSWSLTFRASVPVDYDEVHWQVVNTGAVAQRAGGLRGEIVEGEPTKFESTLYEGLHWVQCFAVANGVCVAKSDEFIVNIE